MQVLVQTSNQIEGRETLLASVAQEIEGELERFADRLTRVEVHLDDVNSSKGGADKHCMIEARPRGLKPIAVNHQAETLRMAIRGATKKLVHALDHSFGKLQQPHATPLDGHERT